MQIGKVFKSVISLLFLATLVNKDYNWFALSLLLERVVFLQLDGKGFENNSQSNKGSSGNKSKVEPSVNKICIYEKNKKLL